MSPGSSRWNVSIHAATSSTSWDSSPSSARRAPSARPAPWREGPPPPVRRSTRPSRRSPASSRCPRTSAAPATPGRSSRATSPAPTDLPVLPRPVQCAHEDQQAWIDLHEHPELLDGLLEVLAHEPAMVGDLLDGANALDGHGPDALGRLHEALVDRRFQLLPHRPEERRSRGEHPPHVVHDADPKRVPDPAVDLGHLRGCVLLAHLVELQVMPPGLHASSFRGAGTVLSPPSVHTPKAGGR